MKTDDGNYDQFADRKTTYKESLYNTTYDIRNFTKEQIDQAYKIEKEIMQQNADGNVHVAEERGQIMLRDNEDEEIQYSGVIRKTKKLNNPKKFKCFHTKLVKIPEKVSSDNALIAEKGWEQLKMKYAYEEKKTITQQPSFTPPQAASVTTTGFYQGGGTSQISSTQNSYIKQVAAKESAGMSFDVSKIKSFVPKNDSVP